MDSNPQVHWLFLRRKESSVLESTDILPKIGSVSECLGVALVFLYLTRVSVLYLWAGSGGQFVLNQGSRVLLVASLLFLVNKGVREISLAGVVFVFLTLPGAILSEYASQSLMRWAGWVLLFVVVGPVLQSDQARSLRQSAWSAFRFGFIVAGILSFGWYIARLPNLGRGVFTGVMLHSMLIGPMAGISVLFCIHQAFRRRSLVFVLLAMLSLIPCLLAGSRSAVIGVVAGVITLLTFMAAKSGAEKSVLSVGMGLFLLLLAMTVLDSAKSTEMVESYTSALKGKGTVNTREVLWKARLTEFRNNPVFGVGIGVKQEGPGSKDTKKDMQVEPGSSYLAVLSMTGMAGTFGLLCVLVTLFRKVWMNKSLLLSDASVSVFTIGAFLSVHMAAEGYVLAVGQSLCLLFWLCLGRMRDL